MLDLLSVVYSRTENMLFILIVIMFLQEVHVIGNPICMCGGLYIENGQTMSTKTCYIKGEIEKIICDPRYIIQGNDKVICQPTGWDTNPTCEKAIGQPCTRSDQCLLTNSICDKGNSCQCPTHTFFTNITCLNKVADGGNCAYSDQCLLTNSICDHSKQSTCQCPGDMYPSATCLNRSSNENTHWIILIVLLGIAVIVSVIISCFKHHTVQKLKGQLSVKEVLAHKKEDGRLETQLSESKDENETLKDEVLAHKMENGQLKTQLSESKDENETLKEEVLAHKMENGQLKAQLSESKDENETLKEEALAHKMENGQLETQLLEYKDEIYNLKLLAHKEEDVEIKMFESNRKTPLSDESSCLHTDSQPEDSPPVSLTGKEELAEESHGCNIGQFQKIARTSKTFHLAKNYWMNVSSGKSSSKDKDDRYCNNTDKEERDKLLKTTST